MKKLIMVLMLVLSFSLAAEDATHVFSGKELEDDGRSLISVVDAGEVVADAFCKNHYGQLENYKTMELRRRCVESSCYTYANVNELENVDTRDIMETKYRLFSYFSERLVKIPLKILFTPFILACENCELEDFWEHYEVHSAWFSYVSENIVEFEKIECRY